MNDIFDDEQNNFPGTPMKAEQGDKKDGKGPAKNSGPSDMSDDNGTAKPARKHTKAEKKESRKEQKAQKQAARIKSREEKKLKKNSENAAEKTNKRKSHTSVGSILLICAGLVIFVLFGSLLIYVKSQNAEQYRIEAENLSAQIAANSIVVYTAKEDIKKGDPIITSGDNANAEKSQIYSSIDPSLYIDGTTSSYAQVDIKKGTPIMMCDTGNTAPEDELEKAVQEAKDEMNKPIELPYKLYADYIDEETGATLAGTRPLSLDSGTNEKAFNLEAEDIDGYILSSISIDGKAVHAFGISKKELRAGTVIMYYYTGKSGWDRHEIKGNIHVTFGYTNQNKTADSHGKQPENTAAENTEETSAEAEATE